MSYIDSLIKHEICPDGSKMNRQHAYRVLATRKNYSQHDDVDHESHYNSGSVEHVIYMANKALKLDSWVFHSFNHAEANKGRKNKGRKKKGRKKKKINAVEALEKAHNELVEAIKAVEERKKSKKWFQNDSKDLELKATVTRLTMLVEELKATVSAEENRKLVSELGIKAAVQRMKKAGGIKVSPDGKDYVLYDQKGHDGKPVFDGQDPGMVEKDLDRAEKLMIYFAEQKKSIENTNDFARNSMTTEEEPILSAIHQVTEEMAKVENRIAENNFLKKWEAYCLIEGQKLPAVQSAAPSSKFFRSEAGKSKGEGGKSKGKGGKSKRSSKGKVKRAKRVIKNISPTEKECFSHMYAEGALSKESLITSGHQFNAILVKEAKDMMDTVARSPAVAQKILETKSELTDKYSKIYENSSAGIIADNFFKKWLSDSEVDNSKKAGTIKEDTEIDPRNLKKKCNWVNIDYTPTTHTEMERDSDSEADDSDDSGNESDDSVATEIGEPHIKRPAFDKRLSCPIIHKVESDARQTFLRSETEMGYEEFGEDRIYKLPFKAISKSEALSNYAKKNHFCYDSVALSDYIVQEILRLPDENSQPLWETETKFDKKCGRTMNTYRSTNKYTLNGEKEKRTAVFTDYEFSDLIYWMHTTKQEYVQDAIRNPAYIQEDLHGLRSQMTQFFPPSVIADALSYFKGYHDIVVMTAGGLKLSPQMRESFNAIKDGTYVDPFKGTEFERGAETEAEKEKEAGWMGTFKSTAAVIAGAGVGVTVGTALGAGLLMGVGVGAIGAALGYSLYNGFGWVANIFDFFKQHLLKIQTFYMALCGAAFVWVVSALFVTGGAAGGVWKAMASPVVRKGFINIISQAINSKVVVSFLGALGTFTSVVGEFVKDVSAPTQMQGWVAWSVSWTPWFWSKMLGLPFFEMFTCFDHIKNMLLKWSPQAILACLVMVGIVKGAGLLTKLGKDMAKTATVGTAATGIGLPIAAVTGASQMLLSAADIALTATEAAMWVFGPIFLKIYYVWSVLQGAISAMASFSFVKGIFQGKVSPVDAIIMFRYVPQMICDWVIGGSAYTNRHCRSVAKIVENAATMALLISFICEVYMDIAFFTGIGGEGGKCGKIIGGTQNQVETAQRDAEEAGKSKTGGWLGSDATDEQKQDDAIKRFTKTIPKTTQNRDGGDWTRKPPPKKKGWFGGWFGLVEPPTDRALFKQWTEK